MALFKEVKCGRCDRRYSSIRSRCPYCGARKNKGGKRAVDLGNKQWQLIAGILILIAIIVAVIILVSRGLSDKDSSETTPPSGNYNSDIGANTVTNSPNFNESPTPSAPAETIEPTMTPTPTPSPTVVAVSLSHTDVTLSYIGESFTISATLVPQTSEATVKWRSENENVANVSSSGLVTAIGGGTTNIICEVGGISESCIVRVTAESISGGSSGNSSGSGSLELSTYDATIHYEDDESFTLSVSGNSSSPSYSSSDSSIASVSSGGTVTAISGGTAYITVSVDGTSLTCIVRVIP